MPGDPKRHDAQDDDESRSDQLNRELIELLNELRVALPGVQVLFAFLLTLPFTGEFGKLSEFEQDVYFATFCATIFATAFLMTPTAYHRLRWRRGDKDAMLRTSNRAAVTGLAFLTVAICGSAFLIADIVFGTTGAAITVVVTAALISGLWFVLPLRREVSSDED
jgi:amino acid transporter